MCAGTVIGCVRPGRCGAEGRAKKTACGVVLSDGTVLDADAVVMAVGVSAMQGIIKSSKVGNSQGVNSMVMTSGVASRCSKLCMQALAETSEGAGGQSLGLIPELAKMNSLGAVDVCAVRLWLDKPVTTPYTSPRPAPTAAAFPQPSPSIPFDDRSAARTGTGATLLGALTRGSA